MSDALRVDELNVRFGGLKAIDDVSIAVPAGEIRGLIGPNGAGKTTLFNAVTGLVEAESGDIVIGGHSVSRLPAHKRAQLGARRTFQSVQLLPNLTVLENVMLGLHHQIGASLAASFWTALMRPAADGVAVDRCREVLDFLSLDDHRLENVDKLPFSRQRWVEVARALVSRPTLLLLDEPAAGLSPPEIEELGSIILRIRDERKATIVLVEHVLSLVVSVSDRVTVLDQGRLLAEGAPDEIMADSKVQAAYLGDS